MGGLFRYADGVDKLLMLIGILGCLGDSLADPLAMSVMSSALDAFGSADQSIAIGAVHKYALQLLYVALGAGFAAFLEGVCWTRTAERQTSRIRTKYLKSVLRQEVSFFDNQDASSTTFQVVSNISADAHSIQDAIAEKIPTCMAQLCAFVFNLIVAILLSWRLALASLPFAIGFIAPGVGFGKYMMDLGIKSNDAYVVSGGIAERAISSIRTVYSYVGEHQTLDRFSHSLHEGMNLGIKQGLVKGLMIGSMATIFATWAFQSWYGSSLVTERGESGGHVSVSAICIILAGMSCMSALPNLPFITEASTAAKRIFETIDSIPKIDSENAKGKVLANVRGQIVFREVHFSYPSRKDMVILQGLNLLIEAGKTVGLVGESGSGKSTIVSLLERFYDPVFGDILLDGHRIKELQLKWLRCQIGLVNQQPILFATSIKENILFGKEDATMELVISTAKAANAHDFIKNLPEGYDTQVGEFGVHLSGGQKQRIAIARALLKDPRILLLDEATSALDAHSESIVQAAIDQASLGKTTIVIAHRLTTIRNVDKIVVLQSGRVIESGSHDELMQINNGEGGVYSEMVKVQQSAINNKPPDSLPHPIEGRYHMKTTYAHSPMSPFSLSRQNRAALTIHSKVPPIQNSPLSTFSDYYLKNVDKLESSPSPSPWRLFQMNAPEWKRALLGCLGAIVFGAIQPIHAYFMGAMVSLYFLDDSSKIKSQTRLYCIIYLCIGVISFFASVLQHYNFAIMGERLTKRVRENFLENVLTFEVGWFDQDENTGAAVCAILSTEANIVRSLVGDRMSLVVQAFTTVALAFLLGLIVAWKVASVTMAIQPFIIASFYLKSVMMKKMSEKAQKAQNEGSQLASEAVVNHRTITAFSSQKRILDIFAATLKGPHKQSIKQSWFSGVGLFTSQVLKTASVALTFWYGGTLMNKGLLRAKDLFLVFFILMSTGKNVADAGTMTSDLSKGSNAIKSTFAVLDRKSKIEPNNPEGYKIEKLLRGEIELKNVFFSYPSRPEQMILQDLSLKIAAGKTVALVGQSGSGKSTIFSLIERFYDPIKGSVLIDNHDVKSYNLRDLRSHIALVSQESTLFAGTIHENIVYGKADATEAEIKEAAIVANAHEFISSMKDGYRTRCGERGVQLSGGQKQRIALARAILKNPSILLLDEATSALDGFSENLVQEALEKMMVGRTCVIVAHRLSTIQKADCIMVIKNGKIVEEGSHHELLAFRDHGAYYSLIRHADSVDKLLMFMGFLGCLGDSLATPLTMYVLSGALNSFGTADQSIAKEVVKMYAIKLLYVAVGVGFAAFLEGVCWTRTAERQTSRIRMEYLKSVLRQEVGFFDNQDVSSTSFQVVSSISADAHLIQDVTAEKIPTCLTQFFAFIFNLVVAFLLSWRLALFSLPFAIGFIVPGVGFGKLMMNLGIKNKEAYGVAGGVAEQAISSIRTVYSYVGEDKTLDSFSHALRENTKIGIKQGIVKGLLIGSMGIIFVTWAFQTWIGSILVTEKGESAGRVFVSGACIIIGGICLMSALPNIRSITEASAAMKGICELIDHIPQIDSENATGKVLADVRGQIEFRDVYFSYPSRKDTLILQGFNLKFKAGKTVGLVGGSGSGKSTIVSLLERFYDPIKGDILLDGHRIKKIQLKWLRSQMGLVNQQPILFATSIKENILFGKEDASMEQVISAAKAANAHDFINKLPEGYDTQVGEFGFQLSGGQKQRIAIARALLKDPRILLLDEATSALDTQSERIVQAAIDQASLGRTTIIIAHRLSTIRNVDNILVLQSGRVVESGSHDELMKKSDGEGGVFIEMMKVQQSLEQYKAPDSPYHPIEGRYHKKAHTPKSPFSVRSSRQNSPASAFIPELISSGVTSILNSPISTSRDSHDSNVEKLESSSPTISNWRLLRMNAPEWKSALLGCLGAVVSGAVQPVYAYCMGTVISVYFMKDSSKLKSEIRFYCFIFLSVGFISFISNVLQHYNFAIMGERLTKRIQENFLQKVLTFEVGWFDLDDNTSAAVCARLSTEATIFRSLVGDRISLLVQVFTTASIAFVLGLIVAWKVAIVMIAIQPLTIASFYSKGVLMKRMSKNAQKAQNEGSQLASEAVVNHRTITAFSSQKRILDLFAATLKGPRKESIKQSWISGVGLFSSQFLTAASIALTFWYGGTLMNKGLERSKNLFLVFFILMSTGKSIADAGTMTSDMSKGSSAIRSIFEILDRKSKIEADNPEGSKIKKTLSGRIELKSVFFSYPSRPEQMIFQGLSLKIEAGKMVALVGQSGSGKSTVLGLIERFYDPIQGSVLIDDYDVKSYNLRDLRSHIALVSQEPTLFAGTINENIVYGKEDATEAEIKEAATLANAHEFISSLRDGYQTYCGERGVQLSGGQKQRVALARAILKNPSILLLDEATSALDSLAEIIVQEALERMMVGRTCVIVAHRLSTIQKADSIVVIKDGKVVEKGSHHELLAIGDHGSYYSLVKLQHSHSH